MNMERFGKLYDMLMTLPTSAPFDMKIYGDPVNLKHQCATPACAIGWYARLFPEDGLIQSGGIMYVDGRAGYYAIAACFRISPEDVEELFGSHLDGKSPKQIAARVKTFVEERS